MRNLDLGNKVPSYFVLAHLAGWMDGQMDGWMAETFKKE